MVNNMATPKFDSQEISFSVDQLGQTIMDNREEYKHLVSEFYKEKPFLYRGKDSSDDDILKAEIEEYYKIIGHCLIYGDSDILYEFGIQPFEKDIMTLARPDSLGLYIKLFKKRFDKEDTEDGMKFYLAMLIRALKTANGQPVLGPIINIDSKESL